MTLPFLDISRPGFSTKSREVLDARAESWCARTPLGFAVLRHAQAGQLLRDRRLRQGSHAWPSVVGLRGRFADFWSASLISLEGPDHKRLRQIAQTALAEDFILSLKPRFHRIAAELIAGLPPEFEMVGALTEPFAGRAITTLLGLPDADAPALAHDASRLGLAMGLNAKSHEATVNAACTRLSDLADRLIDRAARQDDPRFVGRMVGAAKALGVTDRQTLIDLVVITIFGGVDTTRAQLAFAALLFAKHPHQWRWLRAHPENIPAAINEIIRSHPTTTWATREALEDITLDGVTIPEGSTVHIFVHATGTDPAAGGGVDFDIRARRKIHFGFGGGAHHCLGQFVARTDMAAALDEMLQAWPGIRIVGTPELLPDSGNTSPTRMILRPEA